MRRASSFAQLGSCRGASRGAGAQSVAVINAPIDAIVLIFIYKYLCHSHSHSFYSQRRGRVLNNEMWGAPDVD